MDDERLASRTLILTLPAMTVAQAEKLLDFVGSLSEALWAEYGEAMIDLDVLRGPRPEDFPDPNSNPDDDLPF